MLCDPTEGCSLWGGVHYTPRQGRASRPQCPEAQPVLWDADTTVAADATEAVKFPEPGCECTCDKEILTLE